MADGKVKNIFETIHNIGVAHSNHYSVFFVLPQKLINRMNELGYTDLNEINNALELFCTTWNCPVVADLDSSQVRSYGEVRTFPTEFTYTQNVTMSFYLDEKGIILTLFSEWRNMIYQSAGASNGRQNRIIGWYDDYICPKMVLCLTKAIKSDRNTSESASSLGYRNADPFFGVEIFEAWPFFIDPLNPNGESQNAPMVIQVAFRYKNSRTLSKPEAIKEMKGGI